MPMVWLTSQKCGILSTVRSCISIIVNRNIGSSPNLHRLFRKARPGTDISFQDEEVMNRLLAGLPSDIQIEMDSYLDLSAAEITRKYNVIHS